MSLFEQRTSAASATARRARCLASLAFSINAIAQAWVARGRDDARLANAAATPLAEARLARLEQAVDAIALEVERISEAQRFTTKLLNEQVRSTAARIEPSI